MSSRVATSEHGGEPAAPLVRESQTVTTVERAADVLIHFADAGGGSQGVTDIATALGLSKAAVHRLLTALRSRGLVTLDEQTRRYALGPTVLQLGLSCLGNLDARKVAAAELSSLSARTQETATLSIRSGNSRLYVEQVTPPREVIMSVALGRSYPLHAGASSKAFLAFLPEEELAAYLSGVLPKLTESTVTDPGKLQRELQQIRVLGWAQSIGERQSGAASVAAPVFDHSGRPVAVMSVCGPAVRFTSEMAHCTEQLLASSGRASEQMGYRPGG